MTDFGLAIKSDDLTYNRLFDTIDGSLISFGYLGCIYAIKFGMKGWIKLDDLAYRVYKLIDKTGILLKTKDID